MTAPGVVGIDVARGAWIGVALSATAVTAHAGPSIAHVVEAARRHHDIAVIGIDIPIGLPDDRTRAADSLARAVVGPRRASVFTTPIRTALESTDHQTASARNRELTGAGISTQAYHLAARILEVDRFVATRPAPVIEVHPEVCFAEMDGAAITTRKSTWAGAMQRRQLLETHGIVVPDDLGAAGEAAGVDDVLDAAAVAWTARRHAAGLARCMPDPPEVFSDGWPAAIWV